MFRWVPISSSAAVKPFSFVQTHGFGRSTKSGHQSSQRVAVDARPTPVVARFLRTPDAAVHLGLSARTLEKHRCYGTGPVYRKLGGRIVYSLTDLDAWAELGLRRSTSDPGKGTVHPARRMDGYTAPVRR